MGMRLTGLNLASSPISSHSTRNDDSEVVLAPSKEWLKWLTIIIIQLLTFTSTGGSFVIDLIFTVCYFLVSFALIL